MPRAKSYRDLDLQERLARRAQLAELLTWECVLERIKGPLGDSSYRKARGAFDWERFVGTAFPEVQPSLEIWELLDHLQRTRPAGSKPIPRRLLWWIVRAYVGAEDPDAWLLAESMGEIVAGQGPIERLAGRLRAAGSPGSIALQAGDLYHYLARLRQGVRAERSAAITAQLSWETIRDRLWDALRARSYRLKAAPRQLDWRQFARERFPEVRPPLGGKELRQRVQEVIPGYSGSELPRHVVWWAVRVGLGMTDPDAWLRAERQKAEAPDAWLRAERQKAEAPDAWLRAERQKAEAPDAIRAAAPVDAALAERIAAQLEGAVSSEEVSAYILALRPDATAGAAEAEEAAS